MRTAHLGTRLQQARHAIGWSQTQAAKELGITANHLARVERGEKGLSLDAIERAASAYRVTSAWLLGLAGAPKRVVKKGGTK